VGIVSLRRLYPEFYGYAENQALFIQRAAKESIHELGHTFGLRHCPDPVCVMCFSNNIDDTDSKSARFCLQCARQLVLKLNPIHAAA
jgi:archaemetzincin